MSSGLAIPAVFEERRAASEDARERIDTLLPAVGLGDDRHPDLAIYATGSLGRRELGRYSDLDVFLVDTAEKDERIGNLERIRLLSDLMSVASGSGFGEFSNDGEFLRVHPLEELRSLLGTRDDDASNVFTARMLLLLESVPLVGKAAYGRCVEAVLADYWRDAKQQGFIPVFLVNDIVRYWKTLCLNYEAFRADLAAPHDQAAVAKRRLALVKLRFNRLWTCFNALAFLLSGYAERDGGAPGSIERSHALALVRLSPLERLLRTVRIVPAAAAAAQRALDELGWWLSLSDQPKLDLLQAFSRDDPYREARDRGAAFGDAMGELVEIVGGRTPLRRFLLL
jgi:hypothetical protein